MAPACPDIPIVVLPSDNTVSCRTAPAAPVRAALTAAVDALTHLQDQLLDPKGAGPALPRHWTPPSPGPGGSPPRPRSPRWTPRR